MKTNYAYRLLNILFYSILFLGLIDSIRNEQNLTTTIILATLTIISLLALIFQR